MNLKMSHFLKTDSNSLKIDYATKADSVKVNMDDI